MLYNIILNSIENLKINNEYAFFANLKTIFKLNMINLDFYDFDNLFILLVIFCIFFIIYNIIFFYKMIVLVFSIGLLFFISGLYFAYLGAEFIGLILILIYSGAILVLFLYFIMILNINYIEFEIYNIKQTSTFFLFVLCLLSIFIGILEFINSSFQDVLENLNFFEIIDTNTFILSQTNFKLLSLTKLGYLLYNDFCIYIIIVCIILLLSIIGIIFIILSKVEDKKTQDILRQVLNKI
jgi:NADH:ubiquinone oxidoreductase subunit 6 (subunit J)